MALTHMLDISPSSYSDSLSTFLQPSPLALYPGDLSCMNYIKGLPHPLGASSGQCGQEIFLPACSLKYHQVLVESLFQMFLEDVPFNVGSISPTFSNPSLPLSLKPTTNNPNFTNHRIFHYLFWFCNALPTHLHIVI